MSKAFWISASAYAITTIIMTIVSGIAIYHQYGRFTLVVIILLVMMSGAAMGFFIGRDASSSSERDIHKLEVIL